MTGPRQSGKTTMLQHEWGAEARYASFDDPLEREFAREDPNGFLDRFGEDRVIFDEIQYVPEVLPYLKVRIDRERERYGRYLLTGSQQFALMANVSESLAGRISILEARLMRQRSLDTLLWHSSYPEPALGPRQPPMRPAGRACHAAVAGLSRLVGPDARRLSAAIRLVGSTTRASRFGIPAIAADRW